MLTKELPAYFRPNSGDPADPAVDAREACRLLAPPPPAGVEECWAEVEGVRYRYLAGGEGPPLVFLHGLLGYSFSWRLTLPYFAQWFRVIAPDLPGSGFSDRSAKLDASLRGTASLALEFLAGIGVEDFHLVATSRGGGVAMRMAALAGEQGHQRVQSMVLSAPINPWSPVGKLTARVLSHPLGLSLFRRATGLIDAHALEWLGTMYGDASRIPPGTIEGYRAPFLITGGWDNGLAILRTWHADLKELELVLPQIARIPTLLVWGSKDNRVLASSAKQLQSGLGECQLVMMPGVGHLPYEEVPGEFNRVVGEFLKRESGRAHGY